MTEPYKIIEVKESIFADNDRDLVRALTPWLPAPTMDALLAQKEFRIEYIPYDWRLNGTW